MNPKLKHTLLLVSSLVITFIVLRVSLYISPNSNFDVGPYNIHHLFTGLLVLTLAGIPLLLLENKGRIADLLMIGFGVGLSMALDEWVYLIATDGSDTSYLLPVSLWGGVLVVGVTALYAGILGYISHRCAKSQTVD